MSSEELAASQGADLLICATLLGSGYDLAMDLELLDKLCGAW